MSHGDDGQVPGREFEMREGVIINIMTDVAASIDRHVPI